MFNKMIKVVSSIIATFTLLSGFSGVCFAEKGEFFYFYNTSTKEYKDSIASENIPAVGAAVISQLDCYADVPRLQKVGKQPEEIVDVDGSISEMYYTALDNLIPEDNALNHAAKYISIDTSTLKGINADEETVILDHFKKYNYAILNDSRESLKRRGVDKYENDCLAGIVLYCEDIKVISKDSVELIAWKYRGADGAIRMRISVIYKDGKWMVDKADIIGMA